MRPSALQLGSGAWGGSWASFRAPSQVLHCHGPHLGLVRGHRAPLVVSCERVNGRCSRRPQPLREGIRKQHLANRTVSRRRSKSPPPHRGTGRGFLKGSTAKSARQRKRRKPKQKAITGFEDELLQDIMEHFASTSGKAQLKVLLGIGLTYADLRKLLASRIEVTFYRPSTIVRKLEFFTNIVGMDRAELKKNCHQIYLFANLLEVNLLDIQLIKMILKFPRLLEYNCTGTFGPRLKYLDSLGVRKEDLPKIFLQAPAVLELSIRKTLRPRVNYLRSKPGIPEESMRTIIFRHPQLLTYTEESMAERVNFLESFGLHDEKLLKSIISHPQVLHYSVDAMESRVGYLQSIGVAKEALPKMIARMPQLLSLNVQVNMAPKVEYLREELGGCCKTIEANPTFLALSLQNRIIPRYEFMKEKSPKAKKKRPTPMDWFKCSDQVFAGKIAKVPLAEFVAFKKQMLTV